MSRKASLAVDRMSTDALWNTILRDLYRLDQALIGGITSTEKRQRTSRALAVARELHIRGIQLSLAELVTSETAARGGKARSR